MLSAIGHLSQTPQAALFKVEREKAEQPLAIMVPAWQEHGVVGPMAELAASTLDYENYHIFVGTYPNDDKTQAMLTPYARDFLMSTKWCVRAPANE